MTICDEFIKILNEKLNDLYFIELKIQYKNGTKKKLYNVKDLKASLFRKVDFVKIDYITHYNNIFKELTIIYMFDYVRPSKDDRIIQITEDYKDLIHDGNYYKALKRLFSIYKLKRNYKKLVELTKFFNETGEKYEIVSNLKTILLLLQYYDDNMTNKKVMINLKDIGVKYNDLHETIIEYESELNNEAIKNIV